MNKYTRVSGGTVAYTKRNRVFKKLTRKYNYVSFGDSIAAGYAIDSNWETDYGRGSEYGENGNTETTIVPGSYTYLINQDLTGRFGEGAKTTSFAHSGDTVEDLMNKLDHDVVRNELQQADLVTICIGANDLLRPALQFLDNNINEYFNTGDLSSLEAIMNNNLNNLNNEGYASSYIQLIRKLKSINSSARYVFTSIYNPYKYLWLEEGQNGFFKPLLDAIPQMTVLGFQVDELIKAGLLSTSAVRKLFDRVNGIGDWIEPYINRLNDVLKTKVNANGLLLADTKAIYDTVPDRTIGNVRQYNELVNVAFTRGYNVAMVDWGRLWVGSNAANWWTDIITKHVSTSGVDLEGLANEVVDQVVNKVLVNEIDPHPQSFGHDVLKQSFDNALGLVQLPTYTLTYNTGKYGTGYMAEQHYIGIPSQPAYVKLNTNAYVPSVEGYSFTGWNTMLNGTGTSYSNGQIIPISGNVTLFAQWDNTCVVDFYKDVNTFGRNYYNVNGGGVENNTGVQEIYGVDISYDGGVTYTPLDTSYYRGYFAKDGRNYIRSLAIPYGTKLRVWNTYTLGDKVIGINRYNKTTSYIQLNGVNVVNDYEPSYVLTVKHNTDITFEWTLSGTVYIDATAHWNSYINEK